MKADITINAFDADQILRAYYANKLGVEIGDLTIKSWNRIALTFTADGMVEANDLRHRLRIEHSDLFDKDGNPK